MPQKIILNERQREVIINHILNEMVSNTESSINEDGSVNENFLEKIKAGLSKLGRYRVNGKFDFSGKLRKAAAAKIQQLIDAEGNEVIKKLDDKIKETDPKFPNSTEEAKFLNTIMEISAIYDSIVASTIKKPGEEGYLDTDIANGVINALREYVKHFLDVELTGIYSMVDEVEGNTINISEEELNQIDEAWGLNETEDVMSEDKASDIRKQLKAAKGDGPTFDSTRVNTLKSNRLPLTLAGVGSALGGFSWLVNTEWFKQLFETISHTKSIEMVNQTIETKSDIFGSIKPNEGMTQLMNEMNNAGLSPKSSPEEFLNQVKILGGGDMNAGIDALSERGGIFANPNDAKAVLTEIAKNPHGHGDNLGEIFKDNWAGTGKQMGDALVTVPGGTLHGMIVKTIVQAVPKIVMKTGVKLGAGYFVAKGLGAILGPIGVALLAAGALVKIMRVKGARQSRAATLNDLYQSIRNVKGGTGIVEPDGPTIDKDEAQDPKAIENKNKEDGGDKGKGGVKGAGSGSNDDLYNSLRNLFKFVVNNRKMLGVRTADNVGAGGATGDNLTIRPGAKVVWNTTTKKKDENGRPIVNRMKGVVSDVKSEDPDITIVNIDGNPKKPWSVATNKLTPDREKKSLRDLKNFEENIKYSNNHIFEGKYIKDENLIKKLEKTLSFDKLKSFEDFINRVEIIRNKVKKINSSNDKKLDNILSGLDSNPIMATNFAQLFAIDPKNQQAVDALKAFIDDIFVTVYSGKFKHGNMIDKMADLGGSINKLEEADKGYSFKSQNKAFVKDAQDRGRFKNNLIKFLVTAISLFQHLHELKMKAEKGGGKKGGTAAGGKSGGGAGTDGGSDAGGSGTPTATPPSGGEAGASDSDSSSGASGGGDADDDDGSPIPFKPATYESVNGQNKVLTEEIERIKKIMGSLI
jgi:hypothetical protein